jgi:hypothetical protein
MHSKAQFPIPKFSRVSTFTFPSSTAHPPPSNFSPM